MSWNWKGIIVRHQCGLAGVVCESWNGFLHVGLKIKSDDGSEHFVQLNSNGYDTGEQGWLWLMDTADPNDPDSWGVLSDRPLQPVPEGVNGEFVAGWMRAERHLHLQFRTPVEKKRHLRDLVTLSLSSDRLEGYQARMAFEAESHAPESEAPSA